MTAVLDVTPDERYVLGFLVAVEIGHLAHGTREHQEAAAGLREVYSTLMDQPEGPLDVVLSNDELYMLGVRIFADISELEEWWLDHRASLRAIQEPALFPSTGFGRAVEEFYAESITEPETFNFDAVRLTAGKLARKMDKAMIANANHARQLYNKEREAINRALVREREERAARRARRYPPISGREIWRQALRADALSPGEMTSVEIENRQILVVNTGDGFSAIDAICTHVPQLAMFANLSNGRLDLERNCVTCPWHGSQFDLSNGRVVRQPYDREFKRDHFFTGRVTSVLDPKKTATDTRVYPTKVHANYVWVNLG